MFSSSLSLSAGSLFLLGLASSAAASPSYSLVENWHGDKFLDFFNFHVGEDPTNGFVNYVSKSSAESSGLIKVKDSGSVYIGVDHEKTISTSDQGRDSVRIGSKKYYDHSLVIADLAHMPGSACGSWPAFWSVGKNWPGDGEIDIIEGVNLQNHNEIVMHTAGTCSITETGMTGSVNATGCGEDLGTVGCVIEGEEGSYGTSFNKQGGGVYAMEWTEEHLKIWYFPRSKIPDSITSGKPDVTKFGTPMALVQEGCDVANSFSSQSFIFDVTFCGDWAGGVFGDSGCPSTSSDPMTSCKNYVASHPAAFKESYWEINSVKIYQTGVKGIAETTTAKTVNTATHASVAQDTTTKASVAQDITTKAAVTAEDTTTKAAAGHSTATQADTQSSHAADTSAEGTHAAASSATVGVIGELTPASTATAAAATAAAEKTATEAVVQSATQAVAESATKQTTSKSTRYVTEFVTVSTTLCPSAQKSADVSPSSAVKETPTAAPVAETTHSHAVAESVPTQAPAATQATHAGESQQQNAATTQAVQSAAPTTPLGADALSNASNDQGSTSTQRPLPTIIPAPGVNPSASVIPGKPQPTKPLIPSGTDASAATGSTAQGTPSSSGTFALFTSGADKLSARFSFFAVALGVAMAA